MVAGSGHNGLMSVRYVKRLQMVFDFRRTSPPPPELPRDYRWVSWKPELLETHARVKYEGFRGSMDADLFPTFSDYDRCLRLMEAIAGDPSFEPKATWLIVHAAPEEKFRFIANIQGMRLDGLNGKIQNVAVVPDYRNKGFGRLLVAGCLHGFRAAGMERIALEVTADNFHAVRLYEHLGFESVKVVFKETRS